MPPIRPLLVILLCTVITCGALAGETEIRRNIASRLPNLPRIDSVLPGPMKGLWEIRLGSEVIYSDDTGNFVFDGHIIDTLRHVNITEQRIQQLTAVDFRKLPLQDAVTWKQGNGSRRIVVFADPHCSYCKRLEQSLSDVPDVTVHTFLVPVLGDESHETSRAIWCARNKGAVWRDWMLHARVPPPAAPGCNSAALDRNLALGSRHGLEGTPMLVFEDNERVPGILSARDIARKLATLRRPDKG